MFCLKKVLLSVTIFCLVALGAFGLYFQQESQKTSQGLRSPSSLTASSPPPIETVLKTSTFLNSQPEELRIESQAVPYDPMLVSVLASIKSRSPTLKPHTWQHLTLKPLELSETCPGKFKILFKASQSQSPYTFVIFPSFFSSLSSGAFIHQTSHILNKTFNDPHIIAFDGYLSPSFLKDTCVQVPWNLHALSRDIYSRLEHFFETLKLQNTHKGLIGFSGGASIVISLLGHEAQKPEVLFDLGGLSFSPLLHLRSTFHHLDLHHQNNPNPHLGLTTTDLQNVFKISLSLFSFHSPLWIKVLDLYNKNPREFINRAFNELTVVDLKNMLKALKLPQKHLSYYNTFVEGGFSSTLSAPVASREDLDRLFDKATDLKPSVAAIQKPLLVYFSQDDPLASYKNQAFPPQVQDMLNTLSDHPHITLFHPQRGGHTGALLDHNLENLIFSFFHEENPSPSL